MIQDLGCIGHCDCIDFGLIADVDGDYKFITNFNGQRISIKQTAVIGESLQFVPQASGLNENYTYVFQILPPESSAIDTEIYYQVSVKIGISNNAVACVTEGGGGTIITIPAGEPINGFHAIMLKDGQAFIYDPTDISNLNRYVGISLNASITGDDVRIQLDGTIATGYNFTEGADLYSASNGALTTVQSMPISHVIAKSITNSDILLKNFNPIISD